LNPPETGDDCCIIEGEELPVEAILGCVRGDAFCGEFILKSATSLGNTWLFIKGWGFGLYFVLKTFLTTWVRPGFIGVTRRVFKSGDP
jgi:hypothetical protein